MLLERARELERSGDDEAAKSTYVAYLQRAPDDIDALIELGNLALRMGYRAAACTAYRRAIDLDAHNPVALVNLGNAFLQANDLPAARHEYERALSIVSSLPQAHQGLSYVYARLGEETASRRHRDLGFRGNAILRKAFAGCGMPVRALVLVSAAGGDFNTDWLLDRRRFDVTKVFAEYAEASAVIPNADVVVNAIGDADRCMEALHAAERIGVNLDAHILNAPDAVMKTGRVAVAERLRSISGAVTPLMTLLPRDSVLDASLREIGFDYPLLLRVPGHHTGRLFTKVDTPAELPESVRALPGEHLLAIQFIDVRSPDGLVRKYRVMAIEGRLFPLHVAVSSAWKVHFFTADAGEAHRSEDARFLEGWTAVLPHSAIGVLEAIVESLQLEYMGIDFSLDRAGNVVVFEANATMSVFPPDRGEKWEYRRKAAERVIRAFQDLTLERTRR